MSIYLTGSSGFIGKNIQEFYTDKLYINHFQRRSSEIIINEDVVIHLAGKAHDLTHTPNPQEYYETNTELTKKIFDAFLSSNAHTFIFLSSIKAVSDSPLEVLSEKSIPNPKTHYGKSKLLAEQYILSRGSKRNKRVFILRPCMVHGKGNKGNLNVLYRFVSMRIPWILGSFNNKRSYCSIGNLLYCIDEIIHNQKINSGIFNVADDIALSTNKLVQLIAESRGIQYRVWKIPKKIIFILFRIGDYLRLSVNSETLKKLTETYVVDNSKLKNSFGGSLPYTSEEGMRITLNSFK